MLPPLLPALLLSILPLPPRGPAPQDASADAAPLVEALLAKTDEADPALLRQLADLGTPEALAGLTRVYEALGSPTMRRLALRAFAAFATQPATAAGALQRLTDVATQAIEPELRETALDALSDSPGGRGCLAAIVESPADDTVRELALRAHLAGARPEDVEWYRHLYATEKPPEEGKKKGKERGKESPPPVRVITAPLRELAFLGLASTRTSAELVEDADSKLVGVRRRALEELAARRDPAADAAALKAFESRRERPDVRLLAADILLDARGAKFAERLFKEARRGNVPDELCFGLAERLVALDDPGLRGEVVRGLGNGQAQEKRFLLRMAVSIPDPKVDKALIGLSKDKDPDVAVDALWAMGQRGNPVFVARLESVLAEAEDPERLGAAFAALDRLRGSDPAWRAELPRLAQNPREAVRNAALLALGRTHDEGALAPLQTALASPAWTTRLAAARGLEQLRIPAGVGALCQRIGLEEGRMTAELAEILWRLTGQPFRSDGRAWRSWWEHEGAAFRFPSAEELRQRQREREQREEHQVSRSFRGVKVDSRFFGLRIASHHVAFVVDVSGSMNEPLGGRAADADGSTTTRMAIAVKELLACLDALEAGTRFNIITFGMGAAAWKKEAVECSEASFEEARKFLEGLGPLGGTDLFGGLSLALEDPEVDTIFLLSDGEPSVGDVTDPARIRSRIRAANAERGVVIHAIAIGDRFPLLEWLAGDSGGQYRTFP